jgi:hypothetical protein
MEVRIGGRVRQADRTKALGRCAPGRRLTPALYARQLGRSQRLEGDGLGGSAITRNLAARLCERVANRDGAELVLGERTAVSQGRAVGATVAQVGAVIADHRRQRVQDHSGILFPAGQPTAGALAEPLGAGGHIISHSLVWHVVRAPDDDRARTSPSSSTHYPYGMLCAAGLPPTILPEATGLEQTKRRHTPAKKEGKACAN